MIFILHWYICRQVLKAFAFATVILVLVFILGGGAANLITGQGELWAGIRIVLPIAFTMMTPVGLLLGTTLVYGRLAADSEIDACRASGINPVRLLATPVMLSVVATVIVSLSVCQWIPGYIEQFTNLFTMNAKTWLYNKLKSTGSVKVGGFWVYTDEIEEDPSDNRMALRGAAFMETRTLDSGRSGGKGKNELVELTRYGTADAAELEFKLSPPPAQASVKLFNVRMYDTQRNQYGEVAEQPFGPYMLPSLISAKAKWQAIDKLMVISNNPLTFGPVLDKYNDLLDRLEGSIAISKVRQQLAEGKQLELASGTTHYKVSCKTSDLGGELEQKLVLVDATVELTRDGATVAPTVFKAPIADLRVLPVGITTDGKGSKLQWVLSLRAGKTGNPVMRFTPGGAGDSATKGTPMERFDLEPCPVGPEYRKAAEDVKMDDLMKMNPGETKRWQKMTGLDLARLSPLTDKYGPAVGAEAVRLKRLWVETKREVLAEMQYRLSYSFSTLILIPLGACLGMVFRQSHMLTAFAISAAPGLVVMLGILLGRNALMQSTPAWVGVALIWSGNIVCAAVLLYVVKRVLRK